jgi:excinuclease ABC subunit B
VASVSCIYGLGSPEDYANMVCNVFKGQALSRELFLAKLVDMLYERNDIALTRGKFRVRGDVVEVHPATADEEAIRVEFFGDEIDLVTCFDPLTGSPIETLEPQIA